MNRSHTHTHTQANHPFVLLSFKGLPSVVYLRTQPKATRSVTAACVNRTLNKKWLLPDKENTKKEALYFNECAPTTTTHTSCGQARNQAATTTEGGRLSLTQLVVMTRECITQQQKKQHSVV
jgi:hypothetical protein